MFSALNEAPVTMKDIENGLKDCDRIKYAAYRTAAKLRVIQKVFYFDKLQLKTISSIFERHQLQQTENSLQLDQQEVEAVLSDIFFAIKKGRNVFLDVDHFSHLMFSLFLNVFHKMEHCSGDVSASGFESLCCMRSSILSYQRMFFSAHKNLAVDSPSVTGLKKSLLKKKSNGIQVFAFKVGLVLLCEARPREKYHYLFEQLADHNNCLSRKKLEILLKRLISFTEHLGEGLSFGSDLIPGTVESCFQCNIGSLGISEDIFMSWLMQDPQLLVWLSTLYRMQISESVSHNAKCEVCKIFPIEGLRYRCLRCLSYDMCQLCFFTGQLNKKHKLKHPVQEYCCPMTSQQSTKAFLLTLRNRLCKKENKLQYLPALRVDPRESGSLGESTKLLDEMEISSRTVIDGSRISLERFPYKELQNIILQLERQSEEIIPKIDNFCSGDGNREANENKAELRHCLARHRALVRTQVQRLKLLRNYLASSGRLNAKAFLASTPVFHVTSSEFRKGDSRVDSVNLSPITIRTSGKLRKGAYGMTRSNRDLAAHSVTPHEESAAEASEGRSEVDATLKDDGDEVELSTLLGGKNLREVESSFGRGTTWLAEDENGKSQEERLREENEETLEELQCDLRRILNKLQELSVLTAESEEEMEDEKKVVGNETAEVDSLLLDLINGIDRLMGSEKT